MDVGPRKVKSFGGFLRTSEARTSSSSDSGAESASESPPSAPPEKLVLDALMGDKAMTVADVDQQLHSLSAAAIETTLGVLLKQRAVVTSAGHDGHSRFQITDIGKRAASFFEITG